MELVVDTNIVFSLFKKDSFTRKLIKGHELELFCPGSLVKELDKYSKLICSKGKIQSKYFEEVKKSILEIIKVIPESKESLLNAKNLVSHESDIPFLALALKLNVPIWSNDKHFKEQSRIKLFNTEELSKFLKS